MADEFNFDAMTNALASELLTEASTDLLSALEEAVV
jgi:hypothetical protein